LLWQIDADRTELGVFQRECSSKAPQRRGCKRGSGEHAARQQKQSRQLAPTMAKQRLRKMQRRAAARRQIVVEICRGQGGFETPQVQHAAARRTIAENLLEQLAKVLGIERIDAEAIRSEALEFLSRVNADAATAVCRDARR
jgi:hypothetical protein